MICLFIYKYHYYFNRQILFLLLTQGIQMTTQEGEDIDKPFLNTILFDSRAPGRPNPAKSANPDKFG